MKPKESTLRLEIAFQRTVPISVLFEGDRRRPRRDGRLELSAVPRENVRAGPLGPTPRPICLVFFFFHGFFPPPARAQDEVAPLVIMPSRLCVFIRGIGLMMNHPISCLKEFEPIARKVLQDENVAY